MSWAIRSAALLAVVLLVPAGVAACGARGDADERSATVRYVVDGDTLRLRDGAYVRLV